MPVEVIKLLGEVALEVGLDVLEVLEGLITELMRCFLEVDEFIGNAASDFKQASYQLEPKSAGPARAAHRLRG
jgi:hypothetical protein